MAFIEITKKDITIDDSDPDIKPIISAFGTLIEKNGFDHLSVACGVRPRPDFGYFELADRFWRASLCIYALGTTNCFWERGVGFAEPWLFNARHTVELYIKGFILNTIWLSELQHDPHLSIRKEEFVNLRRELGKPHNLLELYKSYTNRIATVVTEWNVSEMPEAPEIDKLTLSSTEFQVLEELAKADETSFRFRYPSLKSGNVDTLQQIDWHHDQTMLFPHTGLPKESGYFFNHINVINHLYELISELKEIESYFQAITQYQDVLNDYWSEYLSQFSDGFD